MKLLTKILLSLSLLFFTSLSASETKKIAYLVSDINIPFWEIMSRGIKSEAKNNGYEVIVYSANNNKKTEIENTVKAIKKDKVAGLVISPINSSTAVTILKTAKRANIPVVISDIGADNKDYVSFISSNNTSGAYNIGKVLAKKMQELGYDKEGSVGIVSIPQKRANGKARTTGFMKAMSEAGIKGAGLKQQVDFSHIETYNHSMELIKNNPNLRALFLQGSDKYHGALGAIVDSGKKGEILLVCFDAEPEFIDIIPRGILVGAAMQQPFLMGEKATNNLIRYIKGEKVQKNEQLEVLAISTDNIKEKMPIIKRNVLGM
jgi:ribose transport system substrate-binding protein